MDFFKLLWANSIYLLEKLYILYTKHWHALEGISGVASFITTDEQL